MFEDFDKYNSIYNIVLELYQKKIIPNSFPTVPKASCFQFYTHGMDVREKIIKLTGYCNVTMDWVEPLSKWINGRKCLEVENS